jgi:cobalt-precorrin-5B (C1)-methyltransferase
MKKLLLSTGFTTGAAAAASARANLYWIIFGKKINKVTLVLPNKNNLDINVNFEKNRAFVIKNSGDDPDITNNAKIYSEVTIIDGSRQIFITGGKGVGIVTKKGLQLPIGSYAINPVPQKIIKQNLIDILPNNKSILITVTIENGEALAKKTFNERLGIVQGLSILGTTGIVTPMSIEAIKVTIELQIDVLLAEKTKHFYLVPGKIGEKFIKNIFCGAKTVQVSNYFDCALNYLSSKGIKHFAIAGHPGKLAKIAEGHYNTHSKVANQANHFITKRLNLNDSFNTVEEIISSGANFNIIAKDISLRILKDYSIYVSCYLCNMKGQLIGKYEV